MGVELRSPRTFLDGTLRPVAAVDVQYRKQNNWHTDLFMRAGVQFEKLPLFDRKIQLLLEYCNGYSPMGSFTGRGSSTLGGASTSTCTDGQPWSPSSGSPLLQELAREYRPPGPHPGRRGSPIRGSDALSFDRVLARRTEALASAAWPHGGVTASDTDPARRGADVVA
jgi:Protein of unknown function (DUF1207)